MSLLNGTDINVRASVRMNTKSKHTRVSALDRGLDYTSMFVSLEMEITITASPAYMHLMFTLSIFAV